MASDDYRTLLANERNFLSWQGLSLSLLFAAIAVQCFAAPTYSLAWSMGTIALAGLGIAAAVTGWWRWRRVDRAVRASPASPYVSLCDEEAITPI